MLNPFAAASAAASKRKTSTSTGNELSRLEATSSDSPKRKPSTSLEADEPSPKIKAREILLNEREPQSEDLLLSDSDVFSRSKIDDNELLEWEIEANDTDDFNDFDNDAGDIAEDETALAPVYRVIQTYCQNLFLGPKIFHKT